jgi:hypothetical protein
MKKFLLASSAVLSLATAANAQWPASKTAENRKVVLEEFTGIHCVYCPDGHKRANELAAANPGKVFVVNIHTGGYATPGAGEPDFRNSKGTSISNMSGMGITGYPTGSVSRHLFSGEAGMATNRGQWASYAGSLMQMSSYVNVGVAAFLDTVTRELHVTAEAYYTADAANANKITVMLLEDGVRGPQTGGSNFYPAMMNPDGTYTHNHMLREVLGTSAFGTDVPTTTQGTTHTVTHTYTIPTMYVNRAPNLSNLKIVAFVTEGQKEIMSGAENDVKIVGTSVKNAAHAFSDVRLFPNPSSTQSTLAFTLKESGNVNVAIFDGLGREVTVIASENMTQGNHSVNVPTANLAAGIYTVKVATENSVSTQQLSVVK